MVSRRGRRIAVVLVPGFKKKNPLYPANAPQSLPPLLPPPPLHYIVQCGRHH